MPGARFDVVPQGAWKYRGDLWGMLSDDLAAVEAVGPAPREEVDVASLHQQVLPYLPPRGNVPNGLIRTINVIHFDSSTTFPVQATWTDDTLRSIIIQNPASSTSSLNIGVGTYNNTSHTTEPDVVPAGSEWVGTGGSRPVFVRASTTGQYVWATVITTRSA